MRITIVKADNLVVVDGSAIHGIDLSHLPPDFHALQWYDTYGDVEYVDPNTSQHSNVHITDILPFQSCVDAWNVKKQELDAAAAIPPVPDQITRRQCALQLLAMGQITDVEALAMTRDGTPPAAIQAYISALPSPSDRTLALIDFAAMNYERSNPLLGAILSANGATSEEGDQFFIAAAAL